MPRHSSTWGAAGLPTARRSSLCVYPAGSVLSVHGSFPGSPAWGLARTECRERESPALSVVDEAGLCCAARDLSVIVGALAWGACVVSVRGRGGYEAARSRSASRASIASTLSRSSQVAMGSALEMKRPVSSLRCHTHSPTRKCVVRQ